MGRIFYILIITVLPGLYACKGKQEMHSSASISEAAKDIAKENVLMGSSVGFGGGRPEQWNRYEVLRSGATDKELLSLTNDTNAVVRCYAFQALTERKTADLFSVVIQHLSDTATINTLNGCLGGSQKAGDFFLESLTMKEGNKRFFQLNKTQKAIIDSLLLFERGNRLEARGALLSEVEPVEKHYKRIRQIVTIENDKMAIVALSKYRKQEDKPMINELLKDPGSQAFGFAAVRNFPDQSFFPVLQQVLRNEITKNNSGNDERLQLLYEAIVQYKDQASRQLLKSVLHEAKDMQYIYHSDYLNMALRKYPATIYKGLVKPVFKGVPKENRGK